MTQKLQCKQLVLYFANFCKEKRNADYKVYTFSLFFTKIATQETHLHPQVKWYILCVCCTFQSETEYTTCMNVLYLSESGTEQPCPDPVCEEGPSHGCSGLDAAWTDGGQIYILPTHPLPPHHSPTLVFITCMYITVLSIQARLMEVRFVIRYMY